MIGYKRGCGCLICDPKFVQIQAFGKRFSILAAFKIEIEFSDLAEIQIMIRIKRNADKALISHR